MMEVRRLYALLIVGVAMVAAAMLLVFATIRHQIAETRTDFHDNLSWYATEFSFELSNLDEALETYYQRPDISGGFDRIKRQFDIFWSRVHHAGDGALGTRFMALPQSAAMIGEAKAALDGIEEIFPDLRARKPQAFATARRYLDDLRMPIVSVIDESYRAASAEAKRHQDFLVSTLKWIIGLFGGILLIGAAVIGILYRDKRNIARLHDQLERRVRERTQEILEKNVALEKANEQLQQFAFVASHDLQEPLRRIKLFSVDLSQELGETISEDQRFAIDAITSAADRLRTMVTRLLAYARISQKSLDRQPVEVNQLIAEIRQDLSMQIAEADAKFEIDTIPLLYADPAQLRQLLQNLIANALKFRASERPCRIKIGWSHMDGSYRINISDNGVGFSQEFAGKMFEPFQQLNTKTAYGGTGIGLAICARVAERHGWTLDARGEPDRGAIFTIELDSASLCEPEGQQAA